MSIKVIDPVCGMPVDPAKSAGSFEYNGASYYFCSIRCLERFKGYPDSFVTRAAPNTPAGKGGAPLPLAAGGPSYTCPMHPEVRRTIRDRVRNAAWRLNLPGRSLFRKLNTSARCIHRSSGPSRAIVQPAE